MNGSTTTETLSTLDASETMLTGVSEVSTPICNSDLTQTAAQTNTVAYSTLAGVAGSMGAVIVIQTIALVYLIIRLKRSTKLIGNETTEETYETPTRSAPGNEDRPYATLRHSSEYEVPSRPDWTFL